MCSAGSVLKCRYTYRNILSSVTYVYLCAIGRGLHRWIFQITVQYHILYGDKLQQKHPQRVQINYAPLISVTRIVVPTTYYYYHRFY